MKTLLLIPTEELDTVAGGQMRTPAPSTIIGVGVRIMTLLDHPKQTLNMIRDFLGIKPGAPPGSTYIPAKENPDGTITPATHEMPRNPILDQLKEMG